MGELIQFRSRVLQPNPKDNGLELLPAVYLAVDSTRRLTEVAQTNGIVRAQFRAEVGAEDRARLLAATPLHAVDVLAYGLTQRLDSGGSLATFARLAPQSVQEQMRVNRRVLHIEEELAERLRQAALAEGDVAVTALMNFLALSSRPTQLTQLGGAFAQLPQEPARPALRLVPIPFAETGE